MSKHTPGPWTAQQKRWSPTGEPSNQGIYDANGNCLATVLISMGDNVSGPRRMADARLISSAPDLLEALQAVCEGFRILKDSDFPSLAKARAAIAKATGETP